MRAATKILDTDPSNAGELEGEAGDNSFLLGSYRDEEKFCATQDDEDFTIDQSNIVQQMTKNMSAAEMSNGEF